jgi:hypothetical protein
MNCTAHSFSLLSLMEKKIEKLTEKQKKYIISMKIVLNSLKKKKLKIIIYRYTAIKTKLDF